MMDVIIMNVCSWLPSTSNPYMVMVEILTTMAILLSCWFIFLNNRQTKGEPPLPPGPRGLPVVGYFPFLGSDLRWTFKDLADIYGPIFRVRLGLKECIVITSPPLVKEVLKDQDTIFAHRNRLISASIATFGASDVAFSDNGPEWRRMKRIFVSDLLSNSSIEASYYIRKNHVKEMINKTYKKSGELVDVDELSFSTVLDFLMSMVWGGTLREGGDASGVVAQFRSVVTEFFIELGAPNVSDYLPFLARFDVQGIKRRMKKAADGIEKLFDIAIAHANVAEDDCHKDFLGYLLQLNKLQDPAKSLTLPQVKAILMDAVIGGVDTTSTAIELAMSELLQHPKLMKNVQDELYETVGLNSTVEESHLPKLKYLNAVLKETLRLHPSLPLLVPHRASKRTTVGGYTIPQNSMVFINAWAIQRDPKIWKNPLEFRPERFLHTSSEKMDLLSLGNQQHEYLPFGYGRRMCPASALAEKMSMYILASLLHAFDWTLPNGVEDVDFSETFGIVAKKTNPLVATPKPRLSDLALYS